MHGLRLTSFLRLIVFKSNIKTRNRKGNLYVLYVALISMLISAFYVLSCFGLNAVFEFKVKNALEAASLAAANDLAKIVINDPYWGFIALTDHPPIGTDTMAEDSEPLPVTGINTITATVRQELIIAHAIGTPEAIACALEDVYSAREAQHRLYEVLSDSIALASSDARDMNGEKVAPLESARKIFEKNEGSLSQLCGFKLKDLTADLGWLKEGSTTNSRIPDFLKDDKKYQSNGNYTAFINVPYKNESFYFAGLSEQSSLVAPSQFMYANGYQMSSIIKLKANFEKELPNDKSLLTFNACAQPYYTEDRTKPPVMALYFPHGVPKNLNTLREMLSSESLSKKIPMMTAKDGDYPVDAKARLVSDSKLPETTVKNAFTRGFFDWLRACHLNNKLSTILANLDYQIDSGLEKSKSDFYLYSFDSQGKMTLVKPNKVPFKMQTTYDNQLYTVAFNAIDSDNASWTFKLRNQVRRLGTINGGKHAGQPMPSLEFVKELNQLSGAPGEVDEKTRFSGRARSRDDGSRLALEFEISSPQQIASKVLR